MEQEPIITGIYLELWDIETYNYRYIFGTIEHRNLKLQVNLELWKQELIITGIFGTIEHRNL